MKVYQALMKGKEGQSAAEVFADFSVETAAELASLVSYDMITQVGKSASEASPYEQAQVFPDYLDRMFMQEQALNKILYSTDGGKAGFKTGLHTAANKDIYALFYKKTGGEEGSSSDWVFHLFVNCYL